MSDSVRTKAIVLRRTNYGEADRIVQFLTPEFGQISVMARGVRREKSRLAGGIELFAICDIVIHRGKSEIGTLTGARLNKFFAQIMTNYDRLQFGYEAIKRVAKASSSVDDAQFFDLLVDIFAALDDVKISLLLAETWFNLRIAELLGGGVNTAIDNHGMKLVEDAHYDYDSHEQNFVFSDSGKFDSRHIKLLRVMTSNRLGVIARIADVDEILPECFELARAVAKL